MTAKNSAVAIMCVFLMLVPPPGSGQAPPAQPSPGFRPAGMFSGIVRPYTYREEAPAQLGNSTRLESLLRAGRIYLSLQDAIALALENNLDIALQRYGPRIADSDILRAKAGSTLRGVSTSVSSAASGAVAQATGAAATGGGGGGTTAVTTGAGVGVPNLDPVATFQYNWAHQTNPQTNSFTTGTNALVTTSTIANFGIQQGFLTGTTVNFGWNNSLTRNNAGRSDFNPSANGNFNLSVSQHLLQGFGIALNNRNIRVAQNNRKVADLVFKAQVITTVSAVIGLYWDLVSFNEDVRVKRQALALAQKLYEDNQKQVQIGTLAPIEVVRAEAQVATSQQDLTVSETRVLQQEMIIKNALSRTGVASPSISDARLVPTDQIRVPDVEAIEPIQDLIARALASRPELAQSSIQVDNTKIGLVATKNEMRPTLDLVASLQNNGLAGLINTLPVPPGQPPRNPANVSNFFIGGYGTVLEQLFRRNFPNYALGFQFNVPLKNRTAQADMIRDQLSLRQQEIRQQQQVNQVRLDVTNALIAVQQARAGYNAAGKARILQEQTLDAEQKKYALGASTNFIVIQSQRDLAAALSTEVTARSTYSKAKVQLDQATGQILESYNVQVEEAMSGTVARPPATLPPPE